MKPRTFDWNIYFNAPNPDGTHSKARNVTVGELISAVDQHLRECKLRGLVDYVKPATSSILPNLQVPQFVVPGVIFEPGTNNGYYVNVGVWITSERFLHLVVMKTFDSADKALEVHNALAKLLLH